MSSLPGVGVPAIAPRGAAARATKGNTGKETRMRAVRGGMTTSITRVVVEGVREGESRLTVIRLITNSISKSTQPDSSRRIGTKTPSLPATAPPCSKNNVPPPAASTTKTDLPCTRANTSRHNVIISHTMITAGTPCPRLAIKDHKKSIMRQMKGQCTRIAKMTGIGGIPVTTIITDTHTKMRGKDLIIMTRKTISTSISRVSTRGGAPLRSTLRIDIRGHGTKISRSLFRWMTRSRKKRRL